MGPFADDEVMEIAEEVETNTELDVGKGLGGKVLSRFRSAMKKLSINKHKNNRETEQLLRDREEIYLSTRENTFVQGRTTTQQKPVVTSRKYNICSEEPFVLQQQTFHLHSTQEDKEYAERTLSAPRKLTLKLRVRDPRTTSPVNQRFQRRGPTASTSTVLPTPRTTTAEPLSINRTPAPLDVHFTAQTNASVSVTIPIARTSAFPAQEANFSSNRPLVQPSAPVIPVTTEKWTTVTATPYNIPEPTAKPPSVTAEINYWKDKPVFKKLTEEERKKYRQEKLEESRLEVRERREIDVVKQKLLQIARNSNFSLTIY